MKGLFIQDKADKITISALNYYGADFKLDVFDQSSNTFIYHNLQMVESAEPVTVVETTVAEDRPAGVESIKVSDVTGYNIHDRIQITTDTNSEIKRVVGIDAVNSELQIHVATKFDITTSSTIKTVGNLGLYYIELSFSAPGTFLVKAKDAIFGLLRTDSIKVVTVTQARTFNIMV